VRAATDAIIMIGKSRVVGGLMVLDTSLITQVTECARTRFDWRS
jgi:hypothetical protein